MTASLAIVALLLTIYGVACLFNRQWALAVMMFLLACLIGPGGISITGF